LIDWRLKHVGHFIKAKNVT